MPCSEYTEHKYAEHKKSEPKNNSSLIVRRKDTRFSFDDNLNNAN